VPFRLDVYHHLGDVSALGAVIETLARIERKVDAMSIELDNLTREVTEIGTTVDSAVTLITGLAQQIRDLQNDPVALAALANSLDAKANELAAAVAANTPTP
jgi:chromosome segregation ATPase